ncbi:class I SAM-dependent methyltransferase [Halobacteria archaeon AArc-curdl1]|uniref:Class I SAM-dependent methyltransferase n=1 Tax=Natronosalvus hydrolyticus TaxID=2979988 RepID=A0AAP2Z924_9EURY|nr:class I SAM-dependent methyltransferase [Halobacteria archaeon AArc-curdl1]
METDPFGRAIRHHYLGTRDEPLIDRDGEETREHDIERWYFDTREPNDWFDERLEGPLLDIGAGVGRDTLYYQEGFETVALEVSDYLVETMRDRGVRDARLGDMFALREHFERNRFRSALSIGTQLGLAGSIAGVRRFLSDLAYVTTPDATAILDNYAPEQPRTRETFAYRPDPAPGLAYRIFHCVYEGDVGRTLLFRLFSVDRLREATIGSPWELTDYRYGLPHESDAEATQWLAVLEKT